LTKNKFFDKDLFQNVLEEGVNIQSKQNFVNPLKMKKEKPKVIPDEPFDSAASEEDEK
jgi:hypothetical protein